MDGRAYSIVNSEARFVPGVEAEEEGVVWKQGDALGKRGADEGGLKRSCVCGVVVEEPGDGLVEILVRGESRRQRMGQYAAKV